MDFSNGLCMDVIKKKGVRNHFRSLGQNYWKTECY